MRITRGALTVLLIVGGFFSFFLGVTLEATANTLRGCFFTGGGLLAALLLVGAAVAQVVQR